MPPQGIENINLTLRAAERSLFNFAPKIIYMDESGRLKSSEPEPIAILVREVGLSDWLLGPRKQ